MRNRAGKKRLPASLLCLCLFMGMLFVPISSYALEEDASSRAEEDTAAACPLTESCALGPDHVGKCVSVQLLDNQPITTFEELITALDEAGEVPSTIIIGGDISLTDTVTIKRGQNITLVDDGKARKINVETKDSPDRPTAFEILEGGALTIRTSTGDPQLLIIDGTNAACARSQNNTPLKNNGDIISCHGSFSLESGTIQNNICEEGWSGTIVVSGPEAHMEMSGGLIRNNAYDDQFGGVIRVAFGGHLELKGGEISNNDTMLDSDINNAALWIEAGGNSSFTMSGGAITRNHGDFGGVFVGEPAYPDFQSIAVMELTGGEISDNVAERYGGGIMICGQASVSMNGGTISGNRAMIGGGIAVYDLYLSMGNGQSFELWQRYFPGEFNMNGGVISGNKAELRVGRETDSGCGGGLYVASNQVVLNAGKIQNNIAERQGGGVYVGSVPYTLHMYDAVITENTASILGGGLWFCPTGDAANTVTNGGAIFGNKAEANSALGAAGDDFVAVPQMDKGHTVTLYDRMLGGGETAWYLDGGVESTKPESGNVLGIPDETPRYGISGTDERITGIRDWTKGIALKAVVSDSAERLAKSQAKLWITGNQAPRGGGVGSNGAVVIGTPQDEWSFEITKAWQADMREEEKKPVTVRLKIGGYELDAITLDESNNWTGSFTQLPNPDTLGEGIVITAVEEGTEYKVDYSEVSQDTAHKKLFLTITNRKKPVGNLTVSKTVMGSVEDKEREFPFTVTITGELDDGVYGGMTFRDNTASFTLRDGESITAVGLPAGAGYEVRESGNDEYTVTMEGNKGVIGEGTTATASFVNQKEDTGSEPPEPEEPDQPEEPEQPEGEIPRTGGSSNSSLWLVLAAASAVGMIGVSLMRKDNSYKKARHKK